MQKKCSRCHGSRVSGDFCLRCGTADGPPAAVKWALAFIGSALLGAVLGAVLLFVASLFISCATPPHNYVPPLPPVPGPDVPPPTWMAHAPDAATGSECYEFACGGIEWGRCEKIDAGQSCRGRCTQVVRSTPCAQHTDAGGQ